MLQVYLVCKSGSKISTLHTTIEPHTALHTCKLNCYFPLHLDRNTKMSMNILISKLHLLFWVFRKITLNYSNT